MPSSYFANRCINPRSNDDYQDLLAPMRMKIIGFAHGAMETYLWYNELPDIDPASIQDPKEYFNQMKTSATTDNGSPKDRFHYAQNTGRI